VDDRTRKSERMAPGAGPSIGQVGARRLQGCGILPIVRKYWQGRMEGTIGNWSLVLLSGKYAPLRIKWAKLGHV